jgi:DNA-dependent RNA polymerase auxiliary subunit epsilon
MKIESSVDWQEVRTSLIKLAEATGIHQNQMKKIVGNFDSMVTELSIEEVECRRKQKQTKKHLEMITKINEEITNYEQMITFGTLLNG